MAQEKKVSIAFRTSASIEIDGLLREPAGQLAEPAIDFIEQKPSPGKSAENQAWVRVLFDDSGIYNLPISPSSLHIQHLIPNLRVDYLTS